MSDTLPVGDELDLLLHKCLFDEEPDGFTEEGFPYRLQTIYDGEQPFIGRVLMNSLLDGDGMLLIVEKMKEKGYTHYELLYRGWDEDPWFSAFSTDAQDNRNEYGGYDDNNDAPTATAYAALRALKIIK